MLGDEYRKPCATCIEIAVGSGAGRNFGATDDGMDTESGEYSKVARAHEARSALPLPVRYSIPLMTSDWRRSVLVYAYMCLVATSSESRVAL